MTYPSPPYNFFRYASLWWAGGWVGVCLLLLASAAVASSALVPVRSITAETDSVLVTLSEAVSFTQTTLPGDAERNLKDRCYVDLTPAVLDRQAQRYVAVDSAAILQVRAAQFRADTVRVVLDLASARSCQAMHLSDPPRLRIAVGPAAEEPPRAEATNETEKTQADMQTSPPEEAAAEQPATRASVTIHPPVERPSRVIALEEAYQLAVVNEEQVAIAARELAKAKLLPWRAVALMGTAWKHRGGLLPQQG